MSGLHQYSSEFAKDIQYFIDIGEIGYAREDLLNPENFPHVDTMPFNDRYKLINEIILKMPDGVGEQSADARPYTEMAAFLLMSIPYNQLSPNEEDMAFNLASMFNNLETNNHHTLRQKLETCRTIAQIYCEIYDIDQNIPIGVIWPKDNASLEAKNYFNHVAAFYTPTTIADLKDKYECESDLSDSLHQAILINREELEKLEVTEMVSWITHELRHAHQREKTTRHVRDQQQQSVSRRINKKMHKAVYFALMEERQAYAFDGWIRDHLKGDMKRSELQITCDLLWFKGIISGSVIDTIHSFDKFSKNRKQIMALKIERSPNTVLAQPTTHPA